MSKFNKALIQEQIIEYLKIPPKQRTSVEISYIAQSLELLSFFEKLKIKYGMDTYKFCCHFLQYKEYKVNEIIFEQGDPGDNFYIILSGTVGISIKQKIKQRPITPKQNHHKTPKNSKNTNQQQQNQEQLNPQHSQQQQNYDKHQTKKLSLTNYNNNTHNIIEDSNEKDVIFYQYTQKHIKNLHQGESFGELALLELDQSDDENEQGENDSPPQFQQGVRTATVTCNEAVSVAFLNKHDYKQILQDKELHKLNTHIDFFMQFPVLRGCNNKFAQQLYMCTFLKTFRKGQIIYNEGDLSEDVYFIKSGLFQLEIQQQLVEDKDAYFYSKNFLPKSFKQYKGKQTKTIQISILGYNQMFGEEEVREKDTPRKYTAKCIEEGQVYIMQKKFLQEKIYEKQKDDYYSHQMDAYISNSQKQHQVILEKNSEINKQHRYLIQQNQFQRNQQQQPKKPSISQADFYPSQKKISKNDDTNNNINIQSNYQKQQLNQIQLQQNILARKSSQDTTMTSYNNYNFNENKNIKKPINHFKNKSVYNLDQEDIDSQLDYSTTVVNNSKDQEGHAPLLQKQPFKKRQQKLFSNEKIQKSQYYQFHQLNNNQANHNLLSPNMQLNKEIQFQLQLLQKKIHGQTTDANKIEIIKTKCNDFQKTANVSSQSGRKHFYRNHKKNSNTTINLVGSAHNLENIIMNQKEEEQNENNILNNILISSKLNKSSARNKLQQQQSNEENNTSILNHNNNSTLFSPHKRKIQKNQNQKQFQEDQFYSNSTLNKQKSINQILSNNNIKQRILRQDNLMTQSQKIPQNFQKQKNINNNQNNNNMQNSLDPQKLKQHKQLSIKTPKSSQNNTKLSNSKTFFSPKNQSYNLQQQQLQSASSRQIKFQQQQQLTPQQYSKLQNNNYYYSPNKKQSQLQNRSQQQFYSQQSVQNIINSSSPPPQQKIIDSHYQMLDSQQFQYSQQNLQLKQDSIGKVRKLMKNGSHLAKKDSSSSSQQKISNLLQHKKSTPTPMVSSFSITSNDQIKIHRNFTQGFQNQNFSDQKQQQQQQMPYIKFVVKN